MEEIIDEKLDEVVSEKMSFSLDNFTGPLDLLYTLVKKNKMEIENIESEIERLREKYCL